MFGLIAARQASASSGSSTNDTSMPNRGSVWRNRLYVPPYSDVLETMWSPADASVRMARVSAACPEASATAATPPSSAATRCSKTSWVGLWMRV